MLIGWGVAVATHAFALLFRKTRRRERIFIDRKARAFAVHLFAYVAVVLVLLFVNVTVTPKVWWFYWVALGWGAGVAFQGWCTLIRRRAQQSAPLAKLPNVEVRQTVAKPDREKKSARPRGQKSDKPQRSKR